MIRVALIGCGRIAGHHCEAIKSVEGVKLAAVCDLEGEKAKTMVKNLRLGRIVTTAKC